MGDPFFVKRVLIWLMIEYVIPCRAVEGGPEGRVSEMDLEELKGLIADILMPKAENELNQHDQNATGMTVIR